VKRKVATRAEISFSTGICPSKVVEYILCPTVVKIALQEASTDKKLKVQQTPALFAPHNASESKAIDEQRRLPHPS
jgi:hypothetical protein